MARKLSDYQVFMAAALRSVRGSSLPEMRAAMQRAAAEWRSSTAGSTGRKRNIGDSPYAPQSSISGICWECGRGAVGRMAVYRQGRVVGDAGKPSTASSPA